MAPGTKREHLRVAEARGRRSRRAATIASARILLARPLVPRREVDEALAGVLAAAPPPPPPPATVNSVWMFFALVLGEILLDCVWHFERAGLRGARRKAELDARRALVLGRQEAGRKAQEHEDEERRTTSA